VGRVARMGEMRNLYGMSVGKFGEKRLLETPIQDDSKMDLREIGRVWIGFIWLRINTLTGFCEHGNGPLGSIKCVEFLN